MRTAIALAAALAFCSAAQAMLAPQHNSKIVAAAVDVAIANDSAGFSPEADYFRAPETRAAKRMCRPQLRIFEKVRLANSCP